MQACQVELSRIVDRLERMRVPGGDKAQPWEAPALKVLSRSSTGKTEGMLREKNGDLVALQEYFQSPHRIDFNVCFLAAKYLNDLTDRGNAASARASSSLRVSKIQKRLVVGAAIKKLLYSDETRKVHYADELKDEGEDSDYSGMLERIPLLEDVAPLAYPTRNDEDQEGERMPSPEPWYKRGMAEQVLGRSDSGPSPPDVRVAPGVEREAFRVYLFDHFILFTSQLSFEIQTALRTNTTTSTDNGDLQTIHQEVAHFAVELPSHRSELDEHGVMIHLHPFENDEVKYGLLLSEGRGTDGAPPTQHLLVARSDKEREAWLGLINECAIRHIDEVARRREWGRSSSEGVSPMHWKHMASQAPRAQGGMRDSLHERIKEALMGAKVAGVALGDQQHALDSLIAQETALEVEKQDLAAREAEIVVERQRIVTSVREAFNSSREQIPIGGPAESTVL